MNAEMNFTRNELNFICEKSNIGESATMEEMKEMGVVSDKCCTSGYGLLAVAGGVLFAIGTVIYTVVAAL